MSSYNNGQLPLEEKLVDLYSKVFHTLGAKGNIPSGYIVSSLWVLKQFAWLIPSGYMVGTFKKYPPIYPAQTQEVNSGHF